MTAVAQAFDTSERDIIVTSTAKIRGGRSAKGRGWVLDAVFACELDGTEITAQLHSFDRFEAGHARVTFEPYDSTSYTVKRAKTAESIRASRNTARAAVMGEAPANTAEDSVKARLAAAELRIGEITSELAALTARFTLLASLLGEDA